MNLGRGQREGGRQSNKQREEEQVMHPAWAGLLVWGTMGSRSRRSASWDRQAPPSFPIQRVGEPKLLPPFLPATQPSPGRALADKKPLLPEAWNINFDTEKGIFYYPGIFLHLFRDLLAQPPPPAASLFRQLKPTLQLTLLILPCYGPRRGVLYGKRGFVGGQVPPLSSPEPHLRVCAGSRGCPGGPSTRPFLPGPQSPARGPREQSVPC